MGNRQNAPFPIEWRFTSSHVNHANPVERSP
jgi:hypothetical protein